MLVASGGARVKMTEERLRRWFGRAAQDFPKRRKCHGRVFFGGHRMKKYAVDGPTERWPFARHDG